MDFVGPALEEDVNSPLDSGLDEVVATPTNGAPSWAPDGETAPMLSSNFLSTPGPNALRYEGHLDAESLRTRTSRSGELRVPWWMPTGLDGYQRLSLYTTDLFHHTLSYQGRKMRAILGVKSNV